MWIIISLIIITACLYKSHLDNNVYSYWKKKGVETAKWRYFVGHFLDTVLIRKSAPELCNDIYKNFQEYNYVPIYKFMTPAVIVRSPELVTDIMVKDFKSFHDNDNYVNENADLVLSNNPFSLRGLRWKVIRNQMTPNYSTSKVRAMFPYILDNSQKLINFLESGSNPEFVMDTKDLAARVTCENFASCSVGFNGQCFGDGNSEFLKTITNFNANTIINGFKTFAVFLCPFFSKLLNLCFFDRVITNFFKRISLESIDYRSKHDVKNNDLLDSLIALKNKTNNEADFTVDDITVHIGGFFFDGVETSSVALSFMFYEIAANPEVQIKLREEIDEVFPKNNELTYELLNDMCYLDCFLKESLRKNVPLPILFKRCTQHYKLPPMFENDKGHELTIDPGTVMIIPVDALQNDEKYYPQPDKCLPERFFGPDPVKGSYLPFGNGPRICLGMKFAKMQLKMAIVTIVRNFELCFDEKTENPLKLDKMCFFNTPASPIQIKIKKRKC